MKTKVEALIVVFLLSATSCGGGGGGGSGAEFAGVWYGNANLVDDTCGIISDTQQFITFNHLVNQDGEKIVVDNGLLSLLGAVTGEKSFTVTVERARAPLASGQTCTEKITWRYESVSKARAEFVVRNSEIDCLKGTTETSCTFAFSGTAYRQGEYFGGPIPIEPGIGGDPEADGTSENLL